MPMLQPIKEVMKKTPLYPVVLQIRETQQIKEWQKKGYGIPAPPSPEHKRTTIYQYAKAHRINTFIETGTLRGETVDAFKYGFDRIFSVELEPTLATKAQELFKTYPWVSIIQGDSATVLPEILLQITEPCLFWLDAHYSGGPTARGSIDTPIMTELKIIFEQPKYEHVILIDDARAFTGRGDYPTIAAVQNQICRYAPASIFMVKDDIIRIEVRH